MACSVAIQDSLLNSFLTATPDKAALLWDGCSTMYSKAIVGFQQALVDEDSAIP